MPLSALSVRQSSRAQRPILSALYAIHLTSPSTASCGQRSCSLPGSLAGGCCACCLSSDHRLTVDAQLFNVHIMRCKNIHTHFLISLLLCVAAIISLLVML